MRGQKYGMYADGRSYSCVYWEQCTLMLGVKSVLGELYMILCVLWYLWVMCVMVCKCMS